jgi:hypothetical protein
MTGDMREFCVFAMTMVATRINKGPITLFSEQMPRVGYRHKVIGYLLPLTKGTKGLHCPCPTPISSLGMELCPLSGESRGLISIIFFHMLNGLKLTPAASPVKFVDIFYDSEALLSTSGCDCTVHTSRRVGFLRNQVTDTAIPMIPGVPKD